MNTAQVSVSFEFPSAEAFWVRFNESFDLRRVEFDGAHGADRGRMATLPNSDAHPVSAVRHSTPVLRQAPNGPVLDGGGTFFRILLEASAPQNSFVWVPSIYCDLDERPLV